MPFVRVTSNAKRASVDVEAVLKAVSKSLSDALDRPEPYVMVDVQLDRDMCFQASTELCAFVEIRSIGKIDTERNPKTVAALTETVATQLNVPADRVFINLDDIAPNNWGALGKVVA